MKLIEKLNVWKRVRLLEERESQLYERVEGLVGSLKILLDSNDRRADMLDELIKKIDTINPQIELDLQSDLDVK